MDKIFQQQIRSMDLNEAGFQAVQIGLNTTASSSLSEHRNTHAMITQCQGQLQQIIRNQVTFGTVDQSAPPHCLTASGKPSATKTSVFWKCSSYHMPIGNLTISWQKSRLKQRSRRSRGSTPQVREASAIKVQFVPPLWLSRAVINYSVKMSCDLVSDQWRWGATLQPLTVNNHPFFLDAIKTLDGDGVRRSFAEGLAKPTDYALHYGYPVPWPEVCLESNLK